MKPTAILLVLGLTACHSHPIQKIKEAAIDCAKAQAGVANGGTDVLQAAIAFVQEFAIAVLQGNAQSAVEAEVAKHGEQFVACVLKDILPKSGEDDPITAAARQIIKTKGWQYK